MRFTIILMSVFCCFVSAELPLDLLKKMSANEFRHEFGERDKSESLIDHLMAEKSMIMESCEVQKHVLSKLRDLVMMSITQVKLCMDQSEHDDLKKYEYKHQPWAKTNEDVKVEKIRGSKFQPIDTRLLSI